MRDFINIGSTPYDEPCSQVGTPQYLQMSRIETQIFRYQIRRQCGSEPEGATLAIKSFEHDFGTYREVVCYYDDALPASLEYALRLESQGPARWDHEAQIELIKTGYCQLKAQEERHRQQQFHGGTQK